MMVDLSDEQRAIAKLQTPTFLNIITELDINRAQLARRQALILQIETLLSERYGAANKMISYVFRFGHPRSMINSADVSALETVLNSVTGAAQLNVLIHSPGGDGTIVEKIVDMCRGHLTGSKMKLRAIVPNVAKSAATLFALGTDEIIMGYSSELGPIDPQVQVNISGVLQYVSALAFVEARDNLMVQLKEAAAKNESNIGLLQQVAGLNIPFTQEIENQIDFAKKTAVRLLERYMLRSKIRSKLKRHEKATEIAEKLLSKQLFPVHGHFISAKTAKNDLSLNVDIIGMGEELWREIWEYYMRAEMQMNIPANPQTVKIKLFESDTQSLITQDTAS